MARGCPGWGQAASVRPAAGSIGGKVVDTDGATIPGARVVLNGGRETVTDAAGRYLFLSVGAGEFKVTVTIAGFSAGEGTVRVQADEPVEVAPMVLHVAESAEVVVTTSRQDLAAAEIKVEESQRLFGFAPNFYVTYDWHAAPLTAKQKFGLAYRNATDPANVLIDEASALLQQANNNQPGYGQGVAGFARQVWREHGGPDDWDVSWRRYFPGALSPGSAVLLHGSDAIEQETLFLCAFDGGHRAWG